MAVHDDDDDDDDDDAGGGGNEKENKINERTNWKVDATMITGRTQHAV